MDRQPTFESREAPVDWTDSVEKGEVTGVAVDSLGRIVVVHRGSPPLVIFGPDGSLLDAWSADGLIRDPHSVSLDGDNLIVTDRERHVAILADYSGNVSNVLGSLDTPSDTGAAVDQAEVPKPAGPFNRPTKVVRSAWGELYATDGYRNARVHRFDADGRLVESVGSYGGAPLQFRLPHGLVTDDEGQVYVCDRENSRVQVLDQNGALRGIWGGVERPTDICIVDDWVVVLDLRPSINFFTRAGRLAQTIPCEPSSHAIAATPSGSLYVAHARSKRITMFERHVPH